MIRTMEGGIIVPSEPPAQTTPIARLRSYPRRSICGSDKAEKNDLAADDTAHGSEDHRHKDGLNRNAAAYSAGKNLHGIDEVACDAGAVEYRGHNP